MDATEEALDLQDTSYDSTTTLDQEIEKKKYYFESHEYNFDRYYDWWDFREMFDLPEDYYNQYWSR